MGRYQKEKLLILTKTYPIPSASYRETTCVAAINSNGKLRRIYPVVYRYLDGQDQFKRWEWIEARIERASSDRRPESFRLDNDSIHRISEISTKNGWAERLDWIRPLISDNFSGLEERRKKTRHSLGLIRPSRYELIIQKADSKDWPTTKLNRLPKLGLFDDPKVLHMPKLKKVPFDFYYQYECETPFGTQRHKHKITDWEASMLFWKCRSRYGREWEMYFRQKLEDDFRNKKELIFLMGTMHRFPDQWLIIGLIYPPKVEGRQQSLFALVPDALLSNHDQQSS